MDEYGTLVEEYCRRKPKYSEKTCISDTSPTTNPIRTGLRLNLGLSDEAED
jgi:hypothetical protein